MSTLNCKGKLLTLDKPVVMGILNVTPDSFYEGSRVTSESAILQQAETMLAEGAFFLDIGGQSTRPGSERVSADEECRRVLPAIEKIRQQFPEALLSIDTYYSEVAAKAVDAGAVMINDVSAAEYDPAILNVAAVKMVPYVLMHKRGDPGNMQELTHYDDVTKEVIGYLAKKIETCLDAGIHDLIVDPGFGFAKTIQQNFELLSKLKLFSILKRPILVGLSRKATIYKTLGITPAEALNGTTVLHTIALQNGASILRVHDVKEAVECVRLVEAMGE